MMKRWKTTALLLTAAMMTGLLSFPSMAATKKITSVTLTVSGTFEVGGDIPTQEIDVTSSSEKFSVGDYEILNGGFEWSETDTPKVEVELYAEEGYSFSLSNAKNINLKGATYVSKTYQDSYRGVKIVMTLPPLSEQTGTIETAQWNGMTTAAWSAASGAGTYELKLYRDGNVVGIQKVTSDTTFDFSSALTKAGSYYYKVRPVNRVKTENKGEWVESTGKYIDAATALAILNGGLGGKWIQDTTGWWYQNSDNSYTVSNWQQINGKWYFFNEKGYMKTGWISWNGKDYYCDDTNGDMLVNTVTKDGHQVGADGARL